MALDTNGGIAPYEAPEKDLYEMGEMPPSGVCAQADVRLGHPQGAPWRS